MNRGPSITANPTLNLPSPSFDVSQHRSWRGVSVAHSEVKQHGLPDNYINNRLM